MSSKPNPGLLPTSLVHTPTASQPRKGDSLVSSGTSDSPYASQNSGHHDAEYYDKWNRERQEAVVRGEDPNERFLAMVREKEASGLGGKVRRALGRFRGGGKKKEGVGKEEEENGLVGGRGAREGGKREEEEGEVGEIRGMEGERVGDGVVR